jgi:glycosyltransferase involved in cell wall biosynthesis
MHVLILNWRDVRSPRAGGAEHVTHEVAKRLVRDGWRVTWLAAAYPGAPPEETIDGVEVIRRGSELTTRLYARRIASRLRPDVVLEEINTLPYFAPAWSSVPVVLYMNQIAGEVWWYEAALPLAVIGRLAEPIYLKAYRHCSAVTISRSSRDDLRRLGIRGEIAIAPMAADVPIVDEPVQRSRDGALVAIGRLTPSKRYDHAIRALAELYASHPRATLTLVGDGRDRLRLKRLAAELDLGDAVIFAGRIPNDEKLRILDASDVLVGTSVREGWGLTISEAAARGIPSVVYDIPGFRDAVVPGRTGVLVDPNPAALAAGVAAILSDSSEYRRLQHNAWTSVGNPTYEPAAHTFGAVLRAAISRRG